MTASIRRAVPEDAQALSGLADRLFIETFVEDLAIPYPAEDLVCYLDKSNGAAVLKRRLEDPAQAVWLAEEEGAPIGYAMAGPATLPHPDLRPADGMLNRLYVERGRRGSGLAQQLMDLALAWLETRHGARPWLGVYSGNLRAQRFYGQYGFEICGEYDDPIGRWLDREFIMRRR